MSLGQFLRRMRLQNGLTIKEVVEQSEGILDKTTISRIERDERGLSLKAAYALSKTYNVSLAEISEYVIGKKIRLEYIPFETSVEERKLIEGYRNLPRHRKKPVREIIRGLALASQSRSSAQARKQLQESLEHTKNGKS